MTFPPFRCYLIFILLFLPFSFSFSSNIETTPAQLIKEMSEGFETAMVVSQEKIRSTPQLTEALATQHIIPHINFKLMSRYVLGKNWKKADLQEQQEFIILFTELLTRFYTKAFNELISKHTLKKGMITYPLSRNKKGSRYVRIKTAITISDESPAIHVHYSLYQSKTSEWQIYDFTIEGISLVTSYRSSFNSIIQKEAMVGLISHLKSKVSQLKKVQ